MTRMLLCLAAGLAAGAVISAWLGAERDPAASAGEAVLLADRVSALERRVREETGRREALAAEVERLRARLGAEDVEDGERAAAVRGSSAAGPEPAGLAGGGERRNGEAGGGRIQSAMAERLRERLANRADPEAWRTERLLQAGFTPDRAEWLGRRAEELRMQALEAEYQAALNGEALQENARRAPDAMLRAELGDAEYERYLEALGRPTRIGVRSVLASSPAERAGLLPGDELVSYGGARVFDVTDLNRLTLEGRPGETVVLDVMRDGQLVQLYVPRGPLGIVGGGRFGPGR